MFCSPPAARTMSPGCRPASSAGSPCSARRPRDVPPAARRCRPSRICLARRARGQGPLLAVANVPMRDFPLGLRDDRHRELFPGVDRLAVDADDPIAGLEAGAFWRPNWGRSAPMTTGCCSRRGQLRALVEDDRHHHDGEQDVHHRAHDQHLEALPFASSRGTRPRRRCGCLRGSRRPSSRSRRAGWR